jgi:phosphopantetheinyl transferase
MPLAFELTKDDFQLLVWKITETEDFFTERIPYRSGSKNFGRALQQMASRYLLDLLHPRFPFEKVLEKQSGKLVIPDLGKDFSLTHNAEYAAAIMSTPHHVGVDIEKIDKKILKVASRFLNQSESDWISLLNMDSKIKYMTLCWSIKETIYKWWAKGGVDFADHIVINRIEQINQGISTVTLSKHKEQPLQVRFVLIDGHWLTYLVESPA